MRHIATLLSAFILSISLANAQTTSTTTSTTTTSTSTSTSGEKEKTEQEKKNEQEAKDGFANAEKKFQADPDYEDLRGKNIVEVYKSLFMTGNLIYVTAELTVNDVFFTCPGNSAVTDAWSDRNRPTAIKMYTAIVAWYPFSLLADPIGTVKTTAELAVSWPATIQGVKKSIAKGKLKGKYVCAEQVKKIAAGEQDLDILAPGLRQRVNTLLSFIPKFVVDGVANTIAAGVKLGTKALVPEPPPKKENSSSSTTTPTTTTPAK